MQGNSPQSLDHIIVGSGMAGPRTAYRLQQRGRKVLVLEKEDHASGRMSSHEIDGHFFDFGAKFIPGYIRAGGVYFCGDYLENPSTEGALVSSIKLLERTI